MGLLRRFGGLRDTNVVRATDEYGDEKTVTKETPDESIYDTDSDTLSLEARNEKEVELHPDNVTNDAQMGQQKAEAVALVWPKFAVYGTVKKVHVPS